jgi:hypothetical protein
LALELGRNARAMAMRRFGLDRFVAGWNCAIEDALGTG